jgi:serine/threonine-protein kinase
VRIGEVVADRYRIDRVLGAGAMGVVVEAYHRLLDQKVAIKFLLSDALAYAGSVERFVREARATVRIKSEHVVRVLDVAVLETGTPYIVMEYLEGSDLAALLEERGPLPVEQAVDLVLQACEAIAEAHELGIVHRDLKPANLFAVKPAEGAVSLKVLDFGISKNLVSPTLPPGESSKSAVLTEDRAIMGSLFYMSPEQMESARDVDSRTDIWALGAILCELVTGRPPFEGQSILQVYFNIVSQPLVRLKTSSPMPEGLEAIIVKCLAQRRERRYANVAELAMALAQFASSEGAASADRVAKIAKMAGPGSGDTAYATTPRNAFTVAEKTLASMTPIRSAARTRPRRPLLVRAVIAMALVGALVSFIALRHASRKSSNAAEAAGPSMAGPFPAPTTTEGDIASVAQVDRGADSSPTWDSAAGPGASAPPVTAPRIPPTAGTRTAAGASATQLPRSPSSSSAPARAATSATGTASAMPAATATATTSARPDEVKTYLEKRE